MQIDAIKIRTSVSQGFVTAGRPFSLTTTVTNPHSEPIDIESYQFHLPYQVQWIKDQIYDALLNSGGRLVYWRVCFREPS